MEHLQHISSIVASIAGVMVAGTLEPSSREVQIEHEISEGGSVHAFDMLIELPDGFDPETDYAVVMFSGGSGTDIDWTRRGAYTLNGNTQQLTISGEPTKNGERIAQALLDAGYGVVRYSTAFRDTDTKPEQYETMRFPDTIGLARKAWDRAQRETGLPIDRLFVLGHSLGATRAALVTEKPAGYVVLAGSYMAPSSSSVRSIVMSRQSEEVEGEDYDGSGTIEQWERAAKHAIEEQVFRDNTPFTTQGESYAWPSDQLATSGSPVLAVWGSLDSSSYQGPIMSHIFEDEGVSDRLTSVYFEDIGQHMGRSEGGRRGPIERKVTERIVDWLDSQTGM
ncbi:MAG: hypothetical protein JJ916_04420 [Phycisphaerales bacterium]|nr:hypothetical protein [Phycisphaerales bacterium]